jgi:UDP-N-acetylglucosamine--N-acetylmuramyl-(pentapeptide) pyrophosphoryl-undecaprenol N-acetylglucosamine transferase
LQPKVRAVGCPIRREIAQGDRREALKYFGLQSNRKTLLVFGGSLSSASINEALSEVEGELAQLSSTWQVLHIAGKHDIEASPADRVLAYCERMDLAYAIADLAVCRGGASTIAELTATATPAVIFPYPHHSDRQQTLNAAGLVQCGAAVCVEEVGSRQGNAELLRKNMIPLMQDSQRLDIMRQASGRQAKISAADEIARWLSGSE